MPLFTTLPSWKTNWDNKVWEVPQLYFDWCHTFKGGRGSAFLLPFCLLVYLFPSFPFLSTSLTLLSSISFLLSIFFACGTKGTAWHKQDVYPPTLSPTLFVPKILKLNIFDANFFVAEFFNTQILHFNFNFHSAACFDKNLCLLCLPLCLSVFAF